MNIESLIKLANQVITWPGRRHSNLEEKTLPYSQITAKTVGTHWTLSQGDQQCPRRSPAQASEAI